VDAKERIIAERDAVAEALTKRFNEESARMDAAASTGEGSQVPCLSVDLSLCSETNFDSYSYVYLELH